MEAHSLAKVLAGTADPSSLDPAIDPDSGAARWRSTLKDGSVHKAPYRCGAYYVRSCCRTMTPRDRRAESHRRSDANIIARCRGLRLPAHPRAGLTATAASSIMPWPSTTNGNNYQTMSRPSTMLSAHHRQHRHPRLATAVRRMPTSTTSRLAALLHLRWHFRRRAPRPVRSTTSNANDDWRATIGP